MYKSCKNILIALLFGNYLSIKKQSEESGCDRLKRTLHFGMKMTDEVKFIFCVEYNGLLTLLLLPVCLD